jgi:hypothetical protein
MGGAIFRGQPGVMAVLGPLAAQMAVFCATFVIMLYEPRFAPPELQDLLDEWLLAGWQARPHDSLRDPLMPRRALSPNEMYAALVAAAGYLPLTLTGEDYLELLPVAWGQINAYSIRIDYRTYAYLRVQINLAFTLREARDAGAGVRLMWTQSGWLDTPPERAVIEARVEADQEDDALERIDNEVDKVRRRRGAVSAQRAGRFF